MPTPPTDSDDDPADLATLRYLADRTIAESRQRAAELMEETAKLRGVSDPIDGQAELRSQDRLKRSEEQVLSSQKRLLTLIDHQLESAPHRGRNASAGEPAPVTSIGPVRSTPGFWFAPLPNRADHRTYRRPDGRPHLGPGSPNPYLASALIGLGVLIVLLTVALTL